MTIRVLPLLLTLCLTMTLACDGGSCLRKRAYQRNH